MGHPGASPSASLPASTRDVEPSEGCDLCGAALVPNPMTEGAYAASGLYICTDCIEAMLDAPADDARSEMGLVGGRH